MITAVDSNVLLDVFLPDPKFGERSLSALESATHDGALVVSEVVVAEVGGHFRREQDAWAAFESVGLQIISSDFSTAHTAGRKWREYRAKGGRRERVVADFLIGAHALRHAQRLLTRDRGYYRTYFPRLRIVEPQQPK